MFSDMQLVFTPEEEAISHLYEEQGYWFCKTIKAINLHILHKTFNSPEIPSSTPSPSYTPTYKTTSEETNEETTEETTSETI